MTYEVNLNEFNGPLDLLLHLIKKEDIDIFDISVLKITEQYLAFIENMKKNDLDISSEYLVMAASLIEMKAKLLLPNKSEEEIEEIEEEKANLIDKLVEYEKYKEITPKFKELEEIRQSVYTRDSDELLKYRDVEDIDYGFNLDDLTDAFKKFLQRKNLEKPLNTKIEKKEYSVNKRCFEIKEKLHLKKKMKFDELFDSYSKSYLVVTFLAILSMARNNELTIIQDNNFNDITVSIKE